MENLKTNISIHFYNVENFELFIHKKFLNRA